MAQSGQPLPHRVGLYSTWYSDSSTNLTSDHILQDAFQQAKTMLRPLIKPRDFELFFTPAGATTTASTTPSPVNPVLKHTLADAQDEVEKARAAYEDRTGLLTDRFRSISRISASSLSTASNSSSSPSPSFSSKYKIKARFWLTELSEKIVYYGKVFDVLVQHHPEYVSLAWGTFKLLFTGIRNHAETAAQLGKALSQIADVLPHHHLHLTLYPTAELQNAVARLYAHVLKFFISALKWYMDGRFAHSVKSIFQPWDLQYKVQIEDIVDESRYIEKLAGIASKAELRDTRLEVIHASESLDLVRQGLSELKLDNVRIQAMFGSKFEALEKSMNMMYQQICVDRSSQHAVLDQMHTNQLLSLSIWDSLPTSTESLRFCCSMRNRHRAPTEQYTTEIHKLDLWSTHPNSDILFLDAQTPLTAKMLLTDTVNLIQDNKKNIIWALRFAGYQDRHMTVNDVMRILVLQALLLGKGSLLQKPFPLTVEQLRDATSLQDWSAILSQVLSSLDHIFVALDADLMAHATSCDRGEMMELLDILRNNLSGRAKIMTTLNSVPRFYADRLERSGHCVKVKTMVGRDWRTRTRLTAVHSKKRRRG